MIENTSFYLIEEEPLLNDLKVKFYLQLSFRELMVFQLQRQDYFCRIFENFLIKFYKIKVKY
jgi:hypothetical protein